MMLTADRISSCLIDGSANAPIGLDPRYGTREVHSSIQSAIAVVTGSNFSARVGFAGLGEQAVVARISDEAGNIGAATNTFELAAYAAGDYLSDASGCVTQLVYRSANDHLERTLTWDSEYRLTGVATNGSAAESYGYDPFGRRIWTTAAGVTNWHVQNGAHVLADLDATGGVLRTYLYGLAIDELIAMTVHTGATPLTYYAIRDHQNTVWSWADESGHVVESYDFDAWGRVLAVRDANGALLASDIGLPTSALGNRFLFQGHEYSWGTGLYQFRARWYDPVTGRWLSNDPIGISGGLNQYAFCANDPVSFTDPYGLYQYTTGNFGLGFLHESNPFNSDGAFARQAMSIGAAMGGTLAAVAGYGSGAQAVLGEAVNNSGQAILDEECASTGWRVAYWGALGVSALGVTGAGVANLFNAGAASVFYSGSFPTGYEAALAGKGSGLLITETMGGRALVALGVSSDRAWRIASAIFAANATGTAQVFLRNPSFSSVWSTVERRFRV